MVIDSSLDPFSVPVKLSSSFKAYIYPTIPRPEFLLAFLVLYVLFFSSYFGRSARGILSDLAVLVSTLADIPSSA